MKSQYCVVQELRILCIAKEIVHRVQVELTVLKAVRRNVPNVRSVATVIYWTYYQNLVHRDIFAWKIRLNQPHVQLAITQH